MTPRSIEILGASGCDEHGAAASRSRASGGPRTTFSAPVYGWFTQGFDTLDLSHAKLLLDELRHEVPDRQMDAARSL